MENPYAAPKADQFAANPYLPGGASDSDADEHEETRRAHVKVEANIKAWGGVFIFIGILLLGLLYAWRKGVLTWD